MAVITALAVGTAVAAGAGAMKANADKKSARAANDANYAQYLDSRGANGNALLPMYADEGTEKMLFDEAVAAYQAGLTNETPAQVVDRYRQIVRGFEPVIQQGDQFVGDIYSGALLQQTLADQQPVLDARTSMARSNTAGIDLALRQQINAIAAEEARKGYSGSGSFANNRLLQATVGARQGAATGESAARLQNAMAVFEQQQRNRETQLKALDIAPNRAQQRVALDQLPATALANLQNARTQPLAFFRMQPGNPPPVQPLPSTGAGQIALSSIGQVAGAAGNYYAQKRNADALAADTAAQQQREYDYNLALIQAMRG